MPSSLYIPSFPVASLFKSICRSILAWTGFHIWIVHNVTLVISQMADAAQQGACQRSAPWIYVRAQDRGERWGLWPEWKNKDTWWVNVLGWKRGFLRIMILACFLLPTESKSVGSALWHRLVRIKFSII